MISRPFVLRRCIAGAIRSASACAVRARWLTLTCTLVTSAPSRGHKVYPYLRGGIAIERPNKVWAADICYIPMAKGLMYLVAIMDWHSRRVLAWRVSNTLDTDCGAASSTRISTCVLTKRRLRFVPDSDDTFGSTIVVVVTPCSTGARQTPCTLTGPARMRQFEIHGDST